MLVSRCCCCGCDDGGSVYSRHFCESRQLFLALLLRHYKPVETTRRRRCSISHLRAAALQKSQFSCGCPRAVKWNSSNCPQCVTSWLSRVEIMRPFLPPAGQQQPPRILDLNIHIISQVRCCRETSAFEKPSSPRIPELSLNF